MRKFKPKNMEELFALKEKVLNFIMHLAAVTDMIFGIVQNEGIVITYDDLAQMSAELGRIGEHFDNIDDLFLQLAKGIVKPENEVKSEG